MTPVLPEPPFTLTLSERESHLWRNLMAHWEKQLQQLRIKNDDSSKDDRETATLRGRIAMLKVVMALDKDLPS